MATTTASTLTPRRDAAKAAKRNASQSSVPRRMPSEVFDALRAITGNGPSRVYDDVREQVRDRLRGDAPNGTARARTHLELIWRVSYSDTIRDYTGRDPEAITIGGSALTHELARIAADEHLGFPTDRGRLARRAVNAWLARALGSQT